MYSRACQRVIRLTILPTRAQPATAATDGSQKPATSSRTVPGRNTVSASSATTMSASVAAKPRFSAAGLPALACSSTVTRGSPAKVSRTSAAVPSVEPSSTTMTGKPARSEASTERMVETITARSLKAGTTTATDSAGAGSPLRRLCQTWLMARTASASTRAMPSTSPSVNSAHSRRSTQVISA